MVTIPKTFAKSRSRKPPVVRKHHIGYLLLYVKGKKKEKKKLGMKITTIH